MMMPANYSAVSAEMVYGGAVADFLPSAWTSANVKTLTTNLVTIVGNTFVSRALSATLGTMFGGTWGADGGDKLFGDDGTIVSLFKYVNADPNNTEMTTLNKFMTVLGVGAAVYNLGTASTKNVTGEKFINIYGYHKNKAGFEGAPQV